MASIECEVVCPQCRNKEARQEFSSRTCVETTFCSQCGFHQLSDWHRGLFKRRKGFGVLRVGFKNGVTSISSFNKAQRWQQRVTAMYGQWCNNPKVKSVSMTRKCRGKWIAFPFKSAQAKFRPKHVRIRSYGNFDLADDWPF